MPIIVKGKMFVNQVEQEQIIPPEKIEEEIELSQYHKEQHGELEKMFNKKSDYLTDMLDLKNNK